MFIPINLKPIVLLLGLFCVAIHTNGQDCEQHQALLDKMEQSLKEKNAKLLAEIYHADAIRHQFNGEEKGIAQIQENAEQFYKDVPDATNENVTIICSDEFMVVRWIGKGKPQQSPNPVDVHGITISKIKDNRIVEEWEEINSLSLMMQMGYTLTPPAGAEDKK